MILACTYSPCVNDPDYFSTVENEIHKLGDFPIIMGGDFNSVMDPILDRKPSHLQAYKSVNVLKELCEGLGIIDIWRILNPTANDFTFTLTHTMFFLELIISSHQWFPAI